MATLSQRWKRCATQKQNVNVAVPNRNYGALLTLFLQSNSAMKKSTAAL